MVNGDADDDRRVTYTYVVLSFWRVYCAYVSITQSTVERQSSY